MASACKSCCTIRPSWRRARPGGRGATLRKEVSTCAVAEKELEAQLYAAVRTPPRDHALTGELPVVTPVTDLETNLTGLVDRAGAHAVLADRQAS